MPILSKLNPWNAWHRLTPDQRFNIKGKCTGIALALSIMAYGYVVGSAPRSPVYHVYHIHHNGTGSTDNQQSGLVAGQGPAAETNQ